MHFATIPATPTPDGWNVYPKEALKALSFVPLGTPNNPTLITFDGKGFTQANLFSGLLDALKDITDRVSLRFDTASLRVASACGRNRSTIKFNDAPKWVGGQQIYELAIVPADQYVVSQRKLEKGEKPILDWLFSAQHKGKNKTQDDERDQTVLVRNGFSLTADGWRAHIRPATGPLALADGVYTIKVKGDLMNVMPSDLEWPKEMQHIFNGHSPDEVIMRIQAGALRAACKKQEAICFSLNGLRWQLKAPWVLDAIKLAKDTDAIGVSINGVFGGQKGEKKKSVYFSGAGWGAIVMQYLRPIDQYHWTPGVPFPGASQPVTIGGYADQDKSVSVCVQIERTTMPAVEMLWPEGL